MPSTGGASRMREVDGGFSCYVVLVRDAFEVNVEKRLGHGQACLHVLAFVNAFRATSLCEHLIDISIEGRALLRSRVPRI